jgi:hypothetical protein
MPHVTRSSDIGLKRGRLICNMPHDDRLEFIAEGLPMLLDSAKSLVEESQMCSSCVDAHECACRAWQEKLRRGLWAWGKQPPGRTLW